MGNTLNEIPAQMATIQNDIPAQVAAQMAVHMAKLVKEVTTAVMNNIKAYFQDPRKTKSKNKFHKKRRTENPGISNDLDEFSEDDKPHQSQGLEKWPTSTTQIQQYSLPSA